MSLIQHLKSNETTTKNVPSWLVKNIAEFIVAKNKARLWLLGIIQLLSSSNPKVALMVEADGGVLVLKAASAYPPLKIWRDFYLNPPSWVRATCWVRVEPFTSCPSRYNLNSVLGTSQVPAHVGTKRSAENMTESPSSELVGNNDNDRVGRGDASRCFDVSRPSTHFCNS